jgi:membrane protease YdiL (CAAX protease family)
MPVLVMSVKLVAYLACIGLTLKAAYRRCCHANSYISSLSAPTFVRSVLASAVAAIPLAIALAITVLFAWLADGPPLEVLGLAYHPKSLCLTASGAALGFGCVMLMLVCGMLGGFIKVRRRNHADRGDHHVPLFFGGLSDYFGGAILEEVVTRGYVFYLLNSAFGGQAAIIGSSLIFALVHLIRPDRIPLIFTLNAFVFGLLTGACRYYTGGLWLPIGLHFGWNVTAGPILGLPYSGIAYDKGIVESDVSGPEWFTGGFYSPDAGVLGTFALLVAAVGLRLIAPVM